MENNDFIISASITADGIKKYKYHCHDFPELMYYFKGEGVLRTEQGNVPFSPGVAILVPAKVMHGSVSNDGFKNISIGFGKKLSVGNELIVKNDNEFSDLYHLCDMIYRLFLQSSAEYTTVSSVLTAIASILTKKNDDCDFIERLTSTIINKFCDVNFNLTKEMCDTGYATDYVRTLFKKKLGVTPLKYLTELRLKYADNLLKISNMSVTDVATASGFSDPLYFSKLYKNKYGVSPKIRQKEQRYEKI